MSNIQGKLNIFILLIILTKGNITAENSCLKSPNNMAVYSRIWKLPISTNPLSLRQPSSAKNSQQSTIIEVKLK